MSGSLHLHRGLLYVGRWAKTAEVRVHDLDGHVRVEGFTFRDPRAGRSQVSGLAVDDDHHVWVADTPVSRVRAFTIFGREVGGLGLDPSDARYEDDGRDAPGLVRSPVDVDVRGSVDGLQLVVACGGERRHAVQLFDEAGALVRSLRPLGDPRGRFRHVRRVAGLGRFHYVVEPGAQRMQVFRDGEFHFAFDVRRRSVARFEPTAVAPLEDGRMIVACGGEASALFLCDATGRVVRRIAKGGASEGCVDEPCDVVVEPGTDDPHTRLAVLDREGERVQVFTLEGRCYGVFEQRA